jgi:NAD(P)-dependent dehydrogenase (short-subunit alcohol dehydrogenase family)
LRDGILGTEAIARGSVAQAGTSYQYRSGKTALKMALSILAKELEPRGINVVLLDPIFRSQKTAANNREIIVSLRALPSSARCKTASPVNGRTF